MKNKKLLLPIIILIVAVIASVAFSCFTGIVQKPQIEKGEFPFSITYKYNSEAKTINGTYVCEYYAGNTLGLEQIRYWNGYIKDNECDNVNYCIVDETQEGTLYICPNIYEVKNKLYKNNKSEHITYYGNRVRIFRVWQKCRVLIQKGTPSFTLPFF